MPLVSQLSHRGLNDRRLPKYLDPTRYYRRIQNAVAKSMLQLGIPLSVTTRVGNYEVRFVVSSFVEYMLRAKLSYTREPVTMRWINNYIGENDVVYDIGANVGAYSLLIGKRLEKGKGVVLAFEPEAANFRSLNRNIVVNGLSGKVVPYSIAFGDRGRPSQFFLSSMQAGAAMHGVDRPESDGVAFVAKHVQGVYVLSVDEFLASGQVPWPNHIKIDVDGSELSIVSSMRAALKDSRLKTIMIEVAEDVSHGQIEELIARAGFEEAERERWEGKRVYNILYVRRQS